MQGVLILLSSLFLTPTFILNLLYYFIKLNNLPKCARSHRRKNTLYACLNMRVCFNNEGLFKIQFMVQKMILQIFLKHFYKGCLLLNTFHTLIESLNQMLFKSPLLLLSQMKFRLIIVLFVPFFLIKLLSPIIFKINRT